MKYQISVEESAYEPGSNRQVLKNKLGIISPEEMFEAESELLKALYLHIFSESFTFDKISFKQLQEWHRNWLQPIYPWASKLRTVDMSKGDFRFAAAKFLDKQIEPFENQFLDCFADMPDFSEAELVQFLAAMHVEFILIHPFREGNGRLSRLLNDVFVTKAGYQPLDYSLWHSHREYYFKAIQVAVLADDYQHMERLIRDVLYKANLR